MAHYENLINNTEDIVVAISHMVVGLCSVTILPLASTYVCQRRAAMTSSSSAHLALPTERHTLGVGGAGYSSRLLAWVNFVCGIRSDWGQNVNRRLGWPIKLWCSWEREGRRGETQKKQLFVLVCYSNTNKMYWCVWESSLFNFYKQKKHVHMHPHAHTQRHANTQPVKWVKSTSSPSLGLAVFTKWAPLLRPVGILQMAIKMHEVCWNRGEELSHLSRKNKTSEREKKIR